MQSLHQSIKRILSNFWTYRLLEFNENIEKLTCRESVRCRIPPKTVMQFTDEHVNKRFQAHKLGSYTVSRSSMSSRILYQLKIYSISRCCLNVATHIINRRFPGKMATNYSHRPVNDYKFYSDQLCIHHNTNSKTIMDNVTIIIV
jgi:hypothetical protein